MKQHNTLIMLMATFIIVCIYVVFGLTLCTLGGDAADAPLKLPVRKAPLAAGLQDYYAIRVDGSLILWGSLEYGEIEEIPFAQAVKLLDHAIGVYTSGESETLAVDSDGTLWSINSNRFQYLIPDFEQDWDNAPLKPLKVMEDVSMAAVAKFHSVILKQDGSVLVQGIGGFGAPWIKGTSPYLVKVMDGAISVGITTYGGWAITTNHELWAWGLEPNDSTEPKKLLDGAFQSCDQGMSLTTLTESGDLLRWGENHSESELLLSGVSSHGKSYAIQEDGSLWIEGVGYGNVAAEGSAPYFKAIDRAAYAAQGEVSMLALDEEGSLWQLTRDPANDQVNSTCLGGGFYTAEQIPSLDNFAVIKPYSSDLFSDVMESDWFSANVKTVYETGLMQGKGGGVFAPCDTITMAEAIAVASRVRSIYYADQADFAAFRSWYQPYVDYALVCGMLNEVPTNLNRSATRAEFASLLAGALPEHELNTINQSIAFADMNEKHPAYNSIMALAKAGIIQGKGANRFVPDTPMLRCEAAAMLSRCIHPELRIGS